MRVLLDSNILLRLAQPTHPHHTLAQDAVSKLNSRGALMCIVPQTVYEFWVVAARPLAANGLGLPVPDSRAEIVRSKKLFSLLPD